jgi:probable rRNA maturation factor
MDPHPSRPELVIDISEPSPDWRASLPEIDRLCRDTAEAALAACGPSGRPAELSLLLADDEAVRRLNREWRGRDKPTNVLSFPAAGDEPGPPGAPLLLGDVALAFETVRAEAAAQGKDLAAHFRHLLVHGILHLLGHDHEEEDEAEAMERLERRILAGLGVADPYEPAEAAHG